MIYDFIAKGQCQEKRVLIKTNCLEFQEVFLAFFCLRNEITTSIYLLQEIPLEFSTFFFANEIVWFHSIFRI
jgi:hypothetical protein